MKLATLGALAVLTLAPVVATAEHYDRGTRYYGRGHYSNYDRGYRYDRGSRSSVDISFGFGSRSYRDYSYVNFGYSRPSRYYYSPPVYVAPPPVYCPPPVTYYRPVVTTYPRYYYGGDSCYSSYGYAQPRAYYYSTGSYYYCP